ncbi:acyl-CoA dehydrogenase family protein [Actinoalloteichus spitiensis]|uniref:acyl-CoA dehydrogenase family protein n=1 Tax=Actinoalloteichus spitiensis TaxID=252394 RepID=UPI00068BBC81|nr:acyl-CoA dehydrogenase family protein [Actinoalloteichus spitiensis]
MDEAYAYERGADVIWPNIDHLIPGSVFSELSEEAEENDRNGRLSDRSVDILRSAGYFALPIPTEFGGSGASLAECCAVQRAVGAADPALAVGANMHLFSLGFMVEHWRRHQDESERLLRDVARDNLVIGSAFAEPGLGGALTRSNCPARRVGDSWIANGVKVPCSLAERSDVLCLQVVDEAGGPESLVVALLPTRSPGVSIDRTWDTLGMRASESDAVRLTECEITSDMVIHRSEPGSMGDAVFAAGLGWFCTTATALYLGAVSASIDQARAALARSPISHLGASRAALPSFQAALGDIYAEVLPLEAACVGLARQLDEDRVDPRTLAPALMALKHQSVEIAIRAVEMASELVGVASYSSSGTASRLIRDVHAVRFHPPTRFVTRQALGRWALNLPWSFELAELPTD